MLAYVSEQFLDDSLVKLSESLPYVHSILLSPTRELHSQAENIFGHD
jgi:hypothetical protein